jgi:clan AA aspartic protease
VEEKEGAVGLTVLKIEVGNPASPEVTESVEFLIDSGAIYSVVPTPILEKLGIKPLAEEEFRLADGSKVVRKKGGAVFRYGERVGVADVIFGEEGDHKLLGAFTLEALGLVLDPLRRELKPLPMILATEISE